MTDCNEWTTEKCHECANMGKVKRLELWWQLYRMSLLVRDLENFRPMDFCWTECTMDKQKKQWLSYEGSNGIIISSEFLTVLRTVTGVTIWTVHCLGNETNNFKQFSILYVPVPSRSYQFSHKTGLYIFHSHSIKHPPISYIHFWQSRSTCFPM